MVFFFLGLLCITSKSNEAHMVQISTPYFNYELARILFVDECLDSELQHYGPCKIS
jgi:hypothetical protein